MLKLPILGRNVAFLKKIATVPCMKMTMATSVLPCYETIALSSPSDFVVHVELNRPQKRNAFNRTMWIELGKCFQELGENEDCRTIVLSGAGDKTFTAGLDLYDMISFGQELAKKEDIARKSYFLTKSIQLYQNSITALEKCPKPVIAAVHGDCIGAGVDLISTADIRYASTNAYFQVKEVDIGMAADVGTLQRLPKIIGSASLANDLIYTGRKMDSKEALEVGFLSKTFDTKEMLLTKAFELAALIAAKSPVAVQTIKRSLIYSRDHSVAEGLEHVALHNMAMLQSEDFMNAIAAQATRGDPPTFSKL